jgi:hypothetical protein
MSAVGLFPDVTRTINPGHGRPKQLCPLPPFQGLLLGDRNARRLSTGILGPCQLAAFPGLSRSSPAYSRSPPSLFLDCQGQPWTQKCTWHWHKSIYWCFTTTQQQDKPAFEGCKPDNTATVKTAGTGTLGHGNSLIHLLNQLDRAG